MQRLQPLAPAVIWGFRAKHREPQMRGPARSPIAGKEHPKLILTCGTRGMSVEHGQLRSDGRVGAAAAFPLRKQEILNLNWLHAQITTSFEQPEVNRAGMRGAEGAVSQAEPAGLRKGDAPR